MKRLFSILLLLCAVLNGVAQRLTDAKVERRVRTALPVKNASTLRMAYAPQDSKCVVYDLSEGGFVIASTDERMPAVLGYCDKGSFARANENPAFRSILKAYAEADPQQGRPLMRRAGLPDAVPPLIKDTWHQEEPYWQQTPVVDGKQCVTGCVAHAMAEVMFYHRHPQRGTGSHTYTDSTGCGQTLTANFAEHVYDWDNILNNYAEGEYTQTQADAVALLLSDCGISVNMRYTPAESGAHTVYQPIALTKYFGYDYGAQLYFRDFFTWNEWNDMLMTELAEGRPILIAAYSATLAHAFVCDGYDEQGYYHINLGLGGDADGFYNMQYLSPDQPQWYDKNNPERGMNLLQSVVIGVKPLADGAAPEPEVHSFGLSRIYALTDSVSRDGEVSIVTCNLSNLGWNLHNDRVALALKDDEGIAAILKDYAHEFMLEEIDDTTYTDTLRFTVPQEVEEGTYRLVPVFMDNGEWKEARTSVGTPNYLRVLVSQDSVVVSEAVEAKVNLTFVDMDFPDTLSVWSIPEHSFTIRNDGAEFCGRIYQCLEPVDGNGEMFQFNQQGMTLMPGEQTTRTFSRTVFGAPPLGLYRLKFYHDVNLFNDSLVALNDVPEHFVQVVRVKPSSIGAVEDSGADIPADVCVYSSSGLLVARMQNLTADEVQSSLKNMSLLPGLYMVRHGSRVLKVIK